MTKFRALVVEKIGRREIHATRDGAFDRRASGGRRTDRRALLVAQLQGRLCRRRAIPASRATSRTRRASTRPAPFSRARRPSSKRAMKSSSSASISA